MLNGVPTRSGCEGDIMAKSCINCGTRIYNGICPNCEEENYIFQTQIDADGMDIDLSDEFIEKVVSQEPIQKARLKRSTP